MLQKRWGQFNFRQFRKFGNGKSHPWQGGRMTIVPSQKKYHYLSLEFPAVNLQQIIFIKNFPVIDPAS
jgi:hypothetical protein